MSTFLKFSFSVILTCLVFTGTGLPPKLQKRVHKELSQVFDTSEYDVFPVQVDAAINELLPQGISGENFYRVVQGESILGYVFVDKAPSKTAEFDYMVVFNSNLEIVHSKVLIYREEYGGEIGSKRWLKQFLGKAPGDRVCHETNIDAISGATISVRSMTNSMDKLLQSMEILADKDIL